MSLRLLVRTSVFFGLFASSAWLQAQSTPDCTTATLTPPSVTAGANGTSSSFSFTTPSACRWPSVPVSDSPWLSVSFGPPPGGIITGGSIGYTATSNNSLAPRTGAITVLSEQFTVTQSGQTSCSYQFGSSSTASLTGSSQQASFSIVVTSGCNWSALTTAPWISMITPSGAGTGSVQFQVQANTTASSRVGQIQVGTLNFTVTQAPLTCTYSLSPSSASTGPAASAGSFNVTAATGCQWTATSNQSWLAVSSAPNGNGNGSVNYSIDANGSGQTRSAVIGVGTASFTLTQTSACGLALSQSAAYYTSAAATGSVTITANSSSCDRSAVSNASWITITSGATGTGSGTSAYSITLNNTGTQRQGTISYGGGTATLTIYQDSTTCTYSLAPVTQSVPAGGGPGSVSVQTACTWAVTSDASWIAFTGGASGSGNGSVAFQAAANPSPTARSGSISVTGGQTVTVTQPGQGCNLAFTPASYNAPTSGGGVTVAISTLSGCAWSASTNSTWI
ncbi:MAG: BACON domain-containing carbohydrate-binding protein, partial [Acidobacteria bacterium]|nr:BACON domain-containing carbohydrate-binding protein [Acidobacteriota bacterium]